MDIDRASASVIGAAVAGVVIVGGIYLLKYKKASHRGSQKQTLKLYHSFPFRSSRCAWLINELGIEDLVDIIPVSLHGPEARDLPKYKKEVCLTASACGFMDVSISGNLSTMLLNV